jgi:hypothetical protein
LAVLIGEKKKRKRKRKEGMKRYQKPQLKVLKTKE